ncbi:MAG TPA: hypothetical protein VKB05_07070 [Pyrinomonadaceae bacterium]|nr:hypothetical protein [Pyrinomonadaceae bacterium]
MIIMYTEYDQETTVLAGYARQFNSEVASKVSNILGPPDTADARHAEATLTTNPAPFFFFGHGIKSGLIAQDHATIDFNKDPHLLSGRLVCATCCESETVLEGAARNHGATGIGYSGKVWLFLSPPYSELMEKCLLAGPRALAEGESAREAGRRAGSECERLAQELIKGPIEDQVYAPFLQMNANRIRVF